MRGPAFLLLLILAGCVAPAPEPQPSPGPAPVVRFVVIGDTGTGEEGQLLVAGAIERVCAERGCDFAIHNGDNIYESGVTSDRDPQFDEKFERPYANLSFPFHMSLGNHDNGGGLGQDTSKGDLQVAYAKRSDRASDKWRMPARHYTFTTHDGLAHFFALDTQTLVLAGDPLFQRDVAGQAQRAWLVDEIARSRAGWRFTFGHHPYVSNGQHGDAGEFDGVPGDGRFVKETYEAAACGKVDVVFAGHDHDLQWLKPVASCGATEFIVSGAGAEARTLDGDRHEAHFARGETLGFVWVELTGDSFHGVVYDAEANLIFERKHRK